MYKLLDSISMYVKACDRMCNSFFFYTRVHLQITGVQDRVAEVQLGNPDAKKWVTGTWGLFESKGRRYPLKSEKFFENARKVFRISKNNRSFWLGYRVQVQELVFENFFVWGFDREGRRRRTCRCRAKINHHPTFVHMDSPSGAILGVGQIRFFKSRFKQGRET